MFKRKSPPSPINNPSPILNKAVLSNVSTTNPVLQPILFDVSLRDGLQALTEEQQSLITVADKMKIYTTILDMHGPTNIEIGSMVSTKLLPIFSDTIELLGRVVQNGTHNRPMHKPNHYILIPNSDKLKTVLNLTNVTNETNFSFITSVSNSFQLKNTTATIRETIADLKIMLDMIDKASWINTTTKLYVSCISECPIEGKIDNDEIVEHLLFYNSLQFDIICLSDTCGTLSLEDFSYIIQQCIKNNMRPNKLSLHLHVKQGNGEKVKQIIHCALRNHIMHFDVSILDTGGCPLTLDRSRLLPNLSYDLFNECVKSYKPP